MMAIGGARPECDGYLAECRCPQGLFASELLEDSYQLLGMSEMGLAPAVFSRISPRTGTPIHAILFQFVIIALLVSLDFNSILCIDNFFSASAAALEFAAIVRLRIKSPELRRPYRIPLSTRGLILLLLIPTAWSLLICYVTITDSIQSASTIGVGLLIGLVCVPSPCHRYAIAIAMPWRARRLRCPFSRQLQLRWWQLRPSRPHRSARRCLGARVRTAGSMCPSCEGTAPRLTLRGSRTRRLSSTRRLTAATRTRHSSGRC